MQNQRFIPGRTRKIRETPAGTEYVLHDTPVVTVSRCGRSITLNSGGHRTATTKNAMNQVSNEKGLNFTVYQHGGDWYVVTGTTRVGDICPVFADGMTFTKS